MNSEVSETKYNPLGPRSSFSDTGGELTSESMPLQSALTAAVQTSVGVTEIDLPNVEHISQN